MGQIKAKEPSSQTLNNGNIMTLPLYLERRTFQIKIKTISRDVELVWILATLLYWKGKGSRCQRIHQRKKWLQKRGRIQLTEIKKREVKAGKNIPRKGYNNV